jgi:hypothetical protein
MDSNWEAIKEREGRGLGEGVTKHITLLNKILTDNTKYAPKGISL